MSALDRDPFPRAPLLAGAALICITILTVAGVQIAKPYLPAPPTLEDRLDIKTSRDLRFDRLEDGSILAVDGASGNAIGTLSDTDGFIEAVLRAFAFERRRQGLYDEPVYRLVRWSDNRVTVQDLGTGKRVNLTAFGPDSMAVFARYLDQ